MKKLWELKDDDKLRLSSKNFKVEKVETFRLPNAKEDSARFVFLTSGKKDYVLYIVRKNKRIVPSLEEASIDKTKRQWWRNFQAIKKLKL